MNKTWRHKVNLSHLYARGAVSLASPSFLFFSSSSCLLPDCDYGIVRSSCSHSGACVWMGAKLSSCAVQCSDE